MPLHQQKGLELRHRIDAGLEPEAERDDPRTADDIVIATEKGGADALGPRPAHRATRIGAQDRRNSRDLERRLSASSCRALRPDEFDAVVQLPLEAGWIANDNPLDDAPVEELAGPFGATARQLADHLGEALDLRMDRAAFAQALLPVDRAVHRQDRRRDLAEIVRPLRADRQFPACGGGIGREGKGRRALRGSEARSCATACEPASGSRQRSIRMPSFLSRSRSAMKLWIQRSSFLSA